MELLVVVIALLSASADAELLVPASVVTTYGSPLYAQDAVSSIQGRADGNTVPYSYSYSNFSGSPLYSQQGEVGASSNSQGRADGNIVPYSYSYTNFSSRPLYSQYGTVGASSNSQGRTPAGTVPYSYSYSNFSSRPLYSQQGEVGASSNSQGRTPADTVPYSYSYTNFSGKFFSVSSNPERQDGQSDGSDESVSRPEVAGTSLNPPDSSFSQQVIVLPSPPASNIVQYTKQLVPAAPVVPLPPCAYNPRDPHMHHHHHPPHPHPPPHPHHHHHHPPPPEEDDDQHDDQGPQSSANSVYAADPSQLQILQQVAVPVTSQKFFTSGQVVALN